MPDPKDNAKATGDFHPPEVEDRAGKPDANLDQQGAGGAAEGSRAGDDAGKPGAGQDQGTPAKGPRGGKA